MSEAPITVNGVHPISHRHEKTGEKPLPEGETPKATVAQKLYPAKLGLRGAKPKEVTP